MQNNQDPYEELYIGLDGILYDGEPYEKIVHVLIKYKLINHIIYGINCSDRYLCRESLFDSIDDCLYKGDVYSAKNKWLEIVERVNLIKDKLVDPFKKDLMIHFNDLYSCIITKYAFIPHYQF